jgi:hypothetical protein
MRASATTRKTIDPGATQPSTTSMTACVIQAPHHRAR